MMCRRTHLRALVGIVAVVGLLVGLGVIPESLAAGGGKGLDRAKEVQEKHTKSLMTRDGVVGTAIGLSEDDRHVVKIYVKSQRDRAGIPKELDGVRVVVEVTGEIRALGDTTARYRPAPIGVSTGHPNITAGTIGARVTDGTNVYALSNNHVYADENQASIGDNVLQPGTADGGTDPADVIGTLYDFEPIKFGRGKNTIDAAIAKCSKADLGNAALPDGYGTPTSTPVSAVPLLEVKKYGRTTGLTTGTVDAINAMVRVGYDTGTARFAKQIIIKPGDFSAGGDSGSLIVTQDGNHPVGLLFAGSSLITIANPIDLVLDRFGVTIDGATSATGTITGKVTDSGTVEPVVGASVSTDTGENATTDSDGIYTLSDVPTGVRTVTASAEGYGNQDKHTAVTDGGESTLDFALVPESAGGGTGTVKGRVTDAKTRAGIAGAVVTTDTGQSAKTNKRGKYSIRNVPVGSRTVRASADGYAAQEKQANVTDGGRSEVNFALEPE